MIFNDFHSINFEICLFDLQYPPLSGSEWDYRRSGVDGEMLGSFKVLKRSIGVRIAHNPQNSCKNAFLTNMDFFCSSENNFENSKKMCSFGDS